MNSLESIPVYVVTVKTFIDRHAHMAGLEKDWVLSSNIFGIMMPKSCLTLPVLAWMAICPTKSISNVLKHFEAQRRFLDTEADVCLVLEDDVLLFDTFEESFRTILQLLKNLSPGWLIFLGGADNKIDDRFLKQDDELIEQYLSTAEAYLLDRHGCERRLDWLGSHKLIAKLTIRLN